MEIFTLTYHSATSTGVIYAGDNEERARDIETLKHRFKEGEDVQMVVLDVWIDGIPHIDRIEVMYLTDNVWRTPPTNIPLEIVVEAPTEE
jgi:hypothetical protein